MMIAIKDMEMPEKCGSCDLFHVESPMHCTVVKGHKTVGAPYGMPRPEWCPLIEIKTDGDTISRAAALDVLYNFAGCIVDTPNGDYHKAYKAYRHRLEILPSAQPEPKTGRWIDDNCSECGQYVFHGDARNFCPNCGAKMENDL